MAIIYLDLISGSDAGDGSRTGPYKTHHKCADTYAANDEIRIAKTLAPTVINTANFTFTDGSVTVNTDASMIGTIAVGDYIGKPTAAGNGAFETFYRVNAVGAATLTLEQKYYGTTANVASVLKVNYATDADLTAAGVTFLSVVNRPVYISGGWDLSVDPPVRNGETWFKSNGVVSRATSWVTYNVLGTTSLIYLSYVNVVESNTGFTVGPGPLSTMQYCTLMCIYPLYTAGGYIKTIDHNVLASVISNAPSLGINNWGNQDITIDNCLFLSTPSYGAIQSVPDTAGVTLNITNCILQGGTSAIFNNVTRGNLKIVFTGTKIRYSNAGVQGVNLNISNETVTGGTIEYCPYGMYLPSTVNDIRILNLNTTRCTYGIYIAGGVNRNIDVIGGTSTNDTYGCYTANNTVRGWRIINRSFITPTTFAISTLFDNGPTYINGCSIDVPSTAKFINKLTGANYNLPRYLIDNCTGYADGMYYANQSITKTSATFRTQAPCLQWTFETTVTQMISPVKLWSTYAASGQGYRIGVWIKKITGWAGTIIPVFKLNGADIYTGTTISALTEDWVQYTYDITAGLVVSNGELSFEVIHNANVSTIFFDDFTVVTI